MKLCAYYGCTELASEQSDGFIFCVGHLAYLDHLLDMMDDEEMDFQPAIAYCLASLNDKALNREELIL